MASPVARTSLVIAALALLAATCLVVTPTAAASGPSCGGKEIPKSTGGYWRCTFADDFGGSSLNTSKWVAQRTDMSGFTDPMSNGCYVNDKDNVRVSNGALRLSARQESAPFTCRSTRGDFSTPYTSGMVSTLGKFAQTYGRFQVRAKVWATRLPGLQSALWLWPVNPHRYGEWPASGEIDIAEMYSAWPNRAVPYIHYDGDDRDPNATNTNCTVANLADWHTYAVEWTASSIKVIYDGRTCLVDRWIPEAPLTRPQPFDQPFIVALTQGLGKDFDPETTPLPATTQVDYVRVWK
jgi:beta-glucanase (GH16 family)